MRGWARFLAIALVAGCASTTGPVAQSLPPSEAAVLLPIARSLAERLQHTERNEWIVDDHTPAADWRIAPLEAEDVQRLTAAVALRNRTTWRLPPVAWPAAVTPVPTHELERLLRGGEAWKRFHRRFPNAHGVVRFSAPAFHEAGDRAAVGVSVACGFLCGYGEMFLLQRSAAGWRIERSIPLWEN